MKNFTQTMGELCEFTFIDGILNCETEKPLEFFIEKGISQAPFKIWMTFPLFLSLANDDEDEGKDE